jgi:hypothetical protein
MLLVKKSGAETVCRLNRELTFSHCIPSTHTQVYEAMYQRRDNN